MASNDLQGYKIQGIFYLNKRTHRIQQNVGGACPLLALSNTLFLNHQIRYNRGGRRIKFQELTDCLTQHLQNMLNEPTHKGKLVKTELQVDKHMNSFNIDHMDSIDIENNMDSIDMTDMTDMTDINIGCDDDDDDIIDNDNNDSKQTESTTTTTTTTTTENETEKKEKEMDLRIRQIEECVSLFPKLEEGLDINIKFSDACDFEENPGYRMFSHYGFKLFHGWVINPTKNKNLYDLIGDKSYDETIDYLISDCSETATDDEQKQLETNKDLIRTFFSESATQLTSYGLDRLYKCMDEQGEDILAIFFRNNHFSTIVKHGGILYEFVTDEGIVDADPQITWQTLSQISGDEDFVNNKFLPIHTNISQYTQIAQYNRMKLAKDSGEPNSNTCNTCNTCDEKKQCENNQNINNHNHNHNNSDDDKLICIFNTALTYINKQSFPKLNTEKEMEDAMDPLISHGLTQRITDTFDIFMCKDYLYGITNLCIDEQVIQIRSFTMKDALTIYNLMCVAHKPQSKYFKNIDFMHNDTKYALILEILPAIEHQHEHEHNVMTSASGTSTDMSDADMDSKKQSYSKNNQIQMCSNILLGCVTYEWIKFNYWDWRESDWEDYDIESVYNNNRYNQQKLLRESGVRTDYFVHILDLCIVSDHNNRGLGSQLLQSLIYGFPSGTKFGVLVSTVHTAAVKCFGKCGFTITRLEQSHNATSDTKYKMTKQSNFSFSQYQSFRNNANITQKKIINVMVKTNNNNSNNNTSSVTILNNISNTNVVIDEINSDDMNDDIDDIIGIDDDDDDDDDDIEQQRQQQQQDDDDDDDIDIDDRQCDDDDIEDEDDDDNNIDRIHCDDHMSMQQQQQQQQHHQMGIDNNILGADMAVNNLFGYHSGNGGVGVGVGVGIGDQFIFQVLCQLDLTQYNNIFTEYNITKDALLHLDPCVVEFMINDENDRNKFLQWLHQYKANINEKNKPSKPPQQQSMTVKTNPDPSVDDNHNGMDGMGIDTDDENK